MGIALKSHQWGSAGMLPSVSLCVCFSDVLNAWMDTDHVTFIFVGAAGRESLITLCL